jgi:hypothetical protein
MEEYFEENPTIGMGDLRGSMALEILQRREGGDSWMIHGKKCSRADVMEIIVDMMCEGYLIPDILAYKGEGVAGDTKMPKKITVANWINDYADFRKALEAAEMMYAFQKVSEAEHILDGSDDVKQTNRDKARADLRMQLAQALHSKKFGKKQTIDVQHHDEISGPEAWTRLKAFLVNNQKLIEEHTGIGLNVPVIEAEVIEDPVQETPDVMTLGMEGGTTKGSFEEGLLWDQ